GNRHSGRRTGDGRRYLAGGTDRARRIRRSAGGKPQGGRGCAMLTDDAILAAVREHGSNRKAAAALGVNARTVDRRMERMRFRGYAPAHDMTHTVPDGYVVKGTSTLYRTDGSIAGQWVKSTLDSER